MSNITRDNTPGTGSGGSPGKVKGSISTFELLELHAKLTANFRYPPSKLEYRTS